MKALKVKGWAKRKRALVEPFFKKDFTIRHWDFIWEDIPCENNVGSRELYIAGGFFGEERMPVNNPVQLITAIVNHTRVIVNCGRRGDTVNIVFTKRMIINTRFIKCVDNTDVSDAQEEYLDEDEDDLYTTEDQRSCAEIADATDYDDVPED